MNRAEKGKYRDWTGPLTLPWGIRNASCRRWCLSLALKGLWELAKRTSRGNSLLKGLELSYLGPPHILSPAKPPVP